MRARRLIGIRPDRQRFQGRFEADHLGVLGVHVVQVGRVRRGVAVSHGLARHPDQKSCCRASTTVARTQPLVVRPVTTRESAPRSDQPPSRSCRKRRWRSASRSGHRHARGQAPVDRTARCRACSMFSAGRRPEHRRLVVAVVDHRGVASPAVRARGKRQQLLRRHRPRASLSEPSGLAGSVKASIMSTSSSAGRRPRGCDLGQVCHGSAPGHLRESSEPAAAAGASRPRSAP
jgi:hypothetical protein